jgi:hypothetical protein
MRTGRDLETIEPPKCRRCEQAMRLIGIERDPDDSRISLQTFQCVCGEFAVSRAARQ